MRYSSPSRQIWQCSRDTLLWAMHKSASCERPTSTRAVSMSARPPSPAPWITTTHAERGTARCGPSLSRVRWVVSDGPFRLSMSRRAERDCSVAAIPWPDVALPLPCRRCRQGGARMSISTGDDPDRTELLATRGPVAGDAGGEALAPGERLGRYRIERSDEHTYELQSLMRTSYAVFCLKKKTKS